MSLNLGTSKDAGTATEGSRLCPIVMACDERFAMPLATALRSLYENNKRHWPIQVHILTDRFSQDMRQRVSDSLPGGAADLRWVEADVELFRTYPLPQQFTPISLARLSIPQLFSGTARRVLYLDADLLVLGDLEELCNMDMGNAPIAAVIDSCIDPDFKAGRIERWPGVPKVENYFNSGVLLFDIDVCIRHELTRQAMDYLSTHKTSPYPDQNALNVACDRAWKVLDSRWNFQGHYLIPTAVDKLPASQRPVIAHFITVNKPWTPGYRSVNARLYNHYRKRTRFRRSFSDIVIDVIESLRSRVRLRSRLRRVLYPAQGA